MYFKYPKLSKFLTQMDCLADFEVMTFFVILNDFFFFLLLSIKALYTWTSEL